MGKLTENAPGPLGKVSSRILFPNASNTQTMTGPGTLPTWVTAPETEAFWSGGEPPLELAEPSWVSKRNPPESPKPVFAKSMPEPVS